MFSNRSNLTNPSKKGKNPIAFFERARTFGSISYVIYGNVSKLEEAEVILLGSKHIESVHQENAKIVGDLFKHKIFPNGAVALCENMPLGFYYSKNNYQHKHVKTPVYKYLADLNEPNLIISGWDKKSLWTDPDRQDLDIHLRQRNKSLFAGIENFRYLIKLGTKIIVDAGRAHFIDVSGEKIKYAKELKKAINEASFKFAYIIPIFPSDKTMLQVSPLGRIVERSKEKDKHFLEKIRDEYKPKKKSKLIAYFITDVSSKQTIGEKIYTKNYTLSYVAYGNVSRLEKADVIFLGAIHQPEIHESNVKLIQAFFKRGCFPNNVIALCEVLPNGHIYANNNYKTTYAATPVYKYLDDLKNPKLMISGWENKSLLVDGYKNNLDIVLRKRNGAIMESVDDYTHLIKSGTKIIVDAGRGHFIDTSGEKTKYTKELRSAVKKSGLKYAYIIPSNEVDKNNPSYDRRLATCKNTFIRSKEDEESINKEKKEGIFMRFFADVKEESKDAVMEVVIARNK